MTPRLTAILPLRPRFCSRHGFNQHDECRPAINIGAYNASRIRILSRDLLTGIYCRIGLDTNGGIHTIPPGPTLGGGGCVDSSESVLKDWSHANPFYLRRYAARPCDARLLFPWGIPRWLLCPGSIGGASTAINRFSRWTILSAGGNVSLSDKWSNSLCSRNFAFRTNIDAARKFRWLNDL